jgi:outer membrane receptor for ferrienterochelin and colicins
LVLAIASWAVAAAQQSPGAAVLIVKVQDPQELPLEGATVEFGNSGRIAVTDASGHAIAPDLPSGSVSLKVSAPDFYSYQSKKIVLTAGETTILTVDLKQRVMVSETVVVTATGTESLAREAPIRTELITPQIVDRQVKTTLAEALQSTISGLRMELNCQNCGFMQLRMNGLEGPYTQILEDGLPTYSGVTAVYGLEQIPAAFVDQIEVVKGGNSALYGPGAVAGVVNLIRREPRENRFRIDALAGWHRGRPEQQAGASAQVIDLPADFAGDFYYRGSNRSAVDRDQDGFSDLGKRRLESGGFGLFRRFFEGKARLAINGVVADEFRRGGDQLDRPAHETWITEQIDSRRYSTAASWNFAVTPNTYYNLRGSHSYYGRKTYYGAGMDPNAYGDTRNPLWVGDAQVGHQEGKHSLLSGYQVWWEHVEDNAPAYGRTYGGTFHNHGFYVQDEWRGSPRLSLIGGVRLDKSNRVDRWVVSPRAGMKFGLTEDLVWRATISTGFRAPAVFDEDLHIAQVGGEGFVLQNSPDLTEEKSISAATGMEYLGVAGGRRYRAGFSGFYTNLRDAFMLAEDTVPGADFRRLLRVNGHGARVYGVDLDGSIQLTSGFGLRSGFTVQRARWDRPEAQFGATRFFRTPERYGFFGCDWDLPAGIEWTGAADYTGPMSVPHYAGYVPADRLEASSSFWVFNTVVSRTFEAGDASKLRLYFNLQNAGDKYQPDLDRGPNRDSAYVYGPAEMRRAVVGMTWEF